MFELWFALSCGGLHCHHNCTISAFININGKFFTWSTDNDHDGCDGERALSPCVSVCFNVFTLYVYLSNIILESFRSFLNFHHFQCSNTTLIFRWLPLSLLNMLYFGVSLKTSCSSFSLSLVHRTVTHIQKDAINNFNFQIITNLCGNFTYCTLFRSSLCVFMFILAVLCRWFLSCCLNVF